jgi:hypothetical protein
MLFCLLLLVIELFCVRLRHRDGANASHSHLHQIVWAQGSEISFSRRVGC